MPAGREEIEMTVGIAQKPASVDRRISRRTDAIYRHQRRLVARRTDRMFAVLMILQWIGGIIIALTVSPRDWAGKSSGIHPHVYAAIFLGGAISSLPILLTLLHPGKRITRYVISIAQMLWSSLLIHLTGGRIEAHFHIFGSLAFLAIYREWPLLIPATVVIAGDHLLGGMFWPESVYGVLSASVWRTLEHAVWVIFEDIFLIISCLQQQRDMRTGAQRQAELEASERQIKAAGDELQVAHDKLEQRVADRTAELSERNAELARVSALADEANRAKTSFLANMSHEIRTPMTAILGYSDVLLEPNQSVSDRFDALQVIRRNAKHLLQLINDILDISKIEAGKMTVELLPVELVSEVADVVSLMRPRAIEKGLEFKIEFVGPMPKTICTDALRLKQILINLLGNSLKFTERGELRLRVRSQRDGEHCRMIFEVSDTGIGMTPDQCERLFRPFTQADESMTRRFGGTGLGLTISQRLAELLGGKITLESEKGKGSIFRLDIDAGSLNGVEIMAEVGESMLMPRHTERTGGITLQGQILLCEDGVDNQRLISMYLDRAGAKVHIAENGRIGVEMASIQKFDLILMDMQMPEMDGYTAASKLRAKGIDVPIIALTANALSDDRARCIASGCTDYLSKPIAKELLLRTIAGYLNRKNQKEDVPMAAIPATNRNPIRSEFASDPDMAELVSEFTASLPARTEKLTQLIADRDLDQLRQVVHQLKGAGGGYGFAEITQLAGEAEHTIKAGAAIEQIQAQVDSLVELLKRVEGFQSATPATRK
jgi:signal transduction histidine kinase/CheY-like chemotaxis protein/HPt (histidine-containing phosphotransfer) domain-containing protein